VAAGEGASTPVGARVAWWHGYLHEGSWAEYTVLPEKDCFTVPASLPLGLAAQVVLNPLTMMGIVEELGPVQPGDYVLQNGANSACGKFLIQYLRWKGLRSINVVRRSEQAAPLKALGADEVISLDKEQLLERVDEITDSQKVKYAVDCVWGPGVNDMVAATSARGRTVAYGLLDGPTAPLQVFPLLLGLRSVTGFAIPSWLPGQSKEQVQSLVDLAAALLANGTVQLPFESFSKDQWMEAIKHAEAPGKAAKGIIFF